jgi:hypothetical protein
MTLLVCRRHAANPVPNECLTCMIANVENLPKWYVDRVRARLIKLPIVTPHSALRNPKSRRAA